MACICLHDKKRIEHFLRKDLYLHIFSIGDLDDFFWPYTIWYGSETNGTIDAVILIYVGLPLPTLLALSSEQKVIARLLASIQHLLPNRFYAHLSPGLDVILNKTHDLQSYGKHYKMALLDKTGIPTENDTDVKRLDMKNLKVIQELYKESYPDNWFDPRMLETGQYFGIREKNRLVSIAGIHVYSPQYRVAALGNIATRPAYRNRGYGRRVTTKLCRSLTDQGIEIGLNVRTDNRAAISCYEKIGFSTVAAYEEFMMQKK
ncbi:GNAT family N-acetyltransferase [bacterium]|nr:GNAT family N-acetyltransferase [bacterium]RQV99321.1 MAG: GNAT family N-acetyltransferase [bacterium]